MQNNNQLTNLNRMELMGNLKTLVKREKELTLEILDYLQEIATRRLFLEMGHSTFFAFLIEELGYCSGTAYLRIQTMKALEIPENRGRVLKDKTSLNTLAKTQSFINHENKALGKHSEPPLTEKEKQELFAAAEGIPANKVEEVLKEKKHEMEVKKSTEQGLPPPLKKILKRFNFEADLELVSMIDELKSLLSHTYPAGALADVLKKALPLAIQEIKIKKGLVKRSEVKQADLKKNSGDVNTLNNSVNHQAANSTKTSILQDDLKYQNARSQECHKIDPLNSNENVSSMKSQGVEAQSCSEAPLNKSWEQKRRTTRAIPVELKRKVWNRDGGCCQYQDPKTGKRCGSTHQLELDHMRPWSVGGGHSLENLWTLCRNHNAFRWSSIVNNKGEM